MSLSLKQLLAENPAAQAEYDANLAAARAEGGQAAKATIEKVSPFLTSEDYGQAVKKAAVAVLKGEQTAANFDAVVSAVDAVREERAAEAAKKESGEQKETPGEQKTARKPGDVVATQEDIDEEIARMKGGN